MRIKNSTFSFNAVKFTSIIGQTTTDSISIVLSGKIGTKFNIYIVYQNMMGTIALAASINSLRFADIIKEVINTDIGSVPFFGSLQVLNIGFSISRGNMITKLLNATLPSDSPLKRYTNNLPDGLSVCFILPIRGEK